MSLNFSVSVYLYSAEAFAVAPGRATKMFEICITSLDVAVAIATSTQSANFMHLVKNPVPVVNNLQEDKKSTYWMPARM
jgi:hypothetical protein